jgi:hypothetical protein
VSYIVAGYSIGIGVLFLFSVGLVLRKRRLERAVAIASQGTDEAQSGPRAESA